MVFIWNELEDTLQVRAAELPILVVGDVIEDVFVEGESSGRLSAEAPVPIVIKKRAWHVAGGTANVIRNLQDLGARPELATIAPKVLPTALGELKRSMGSAMHVLSVEDYPVNVKTRYRVGAQQVFRIDAFGGTRDLHPEEEDAFLRVLLPAFSRAQVLVLSEYGSLLSVRLAQKLIMQARKSGCLVVVDPKVLDWRKYAGSDLLTPNHLELGRYARLGHIDSSSTKEITEAAKKVVAELRLQGLVVTRAEGGASYVGADGAIFHVPTDSVDVYDVSGAGDTFVSLLSLLWGWKDPETVLHVCNAAGRVAVGKRGTATVGFSELLAELHGNPGRKLYSERDLPAIVRTWESTGLKIGLTNGCFDLLHPGHIDGLKRAKKYVDKLVVGINSDDSVRRLKGPSRPIHKAEDRARILSALEDVDAVVIFAGDTAESLVKVVRPTVYFKGADYAELDFPEKHATLHGGGKVMFLDLVPGYSSSAVVQKVRGRGKA